MSAAAWMLIVGGLLGLVLGAYLGVVIFIWLVRSLLGDAPGESR